MTHVSPSLSPADTNILRAKSGFYRQSGKRMFDVALALILLAVIAPFVAVLWLLITRNGGSGFYRQTRVGQNGASFKFWKLRTMVPDADAVLQQLCESNPKIAEEWRCNQKLESDPRVTGIGNILRAFSIDELPQIWNVLRGDMSFVGPRPFLVSQEGLYRASGGATYFQLRPGITGLWQVSDRGRTPFAGRIRYDNAYGEDISCFNDLVLLAKTALVVVKRTGK